MFVSMCDGDCVAVWDNVCVAVRKEYLAIRFAVADSEL